MLLDLILIIVDVLPKTRGQKKRELREMESKLESLSNRCIMNYTPEMWYEYHHEYKILCDKVEKLKGEI